MNYHFSKNYELLWKFIQKGEQIICRNGKVPDIATYIPFNLLYGTDDIKEFIEICKKYNLEFIIPGEVDELVGMLGKLLYAGRNYFESRTYTEAKELLKKYEVK